MTALEDPQEANLRTSLSDYFLRLIQAEAADTGAIEAVIEVQQGRFNHAARAHLTAVVLVAAIQDDTVWDAMQQARHVFIFDRRA